MKLVGAISTAVLSLSLGVGIPAYAQQEQHDQQEENKDKPAQDKRKEGATREHRQARRENARQEDKNTKPEEKNAPAGRQQRDAKQSQARKAGRARQGNGGRIPDDRFKANFGREHSFRVSEGDYRNHRFQYGGYWFGFVDPWPSNWLYTQDVYVVEINGVYYLCNAELSGREHCNQRHDVEMSRLAVGRKLLNYDLLNYDRRGSTL